MKKLRITVNGKEYEVEVEILEDSDHGAMPQMPFPAYNQGVAPVAPPVAAPTPAAPRPKAAFKASSGSSNQLTSPMNGVVIEIPAAVGQTVKEGQVVVILEAMKMKTNIASSRDGVISEISIKVNDTVEAGQVLLSYE